MRGAPIILFALFLAALAGATLAAPSAESLLAGLPNASFPEPDRIAAGAIGPNDIATLQKAGVREVINLRAPEETPGFDEAAATRKAGFTYHDLPIRGAGDLTPDNVRRFDKLITEAGDRFTLVHCASSNRVGAMIALRAALIDGQSTEAAIAEGQRWGLKSLEPAVRDRLEAWSTPSRQPSAPAH